MSPDPQRRRKQWLHLHVPLAVALVVCTAATVVEFSRATDGVTRAWAYTFQWPLFGLFAIWMWVRYRREDRGDTTPRRAPFAGLTDHWRERVAQAEADAQEVAAWQAHVAEMRRRESALASPGSVVGASGAGDQDVTGGHDQHRAQDPQPVRDGRA